MYKKETKMATIKTNEINSDMDPIYNFVCASLRTYVCVSVFLSECECVLIYLWWNVY